MINPIFFLPNILDGEDKSSVLANRIRKNYRHLRKWAKRTMTDCFRIYDREIHQYPLSIDFYAGRFCVHYFSKTRLSMHPSLELKEEVHRTLKMIFGVNEENVYWRTHAKDKTSRQYEKLSETNHFFYVFEYGAKFKVNLEDYLDTGLFLDHRETRQIVAKEVRQKRLLNLFAHTCSFSVQAALKGAAFTKSVDMSNTYTAWGEDNFKLNGIPLENNPIVREDCFKFLDQEIRGQVYYDVIVLDPPTISRSKKMDGLFDIQEDYAILIAKCLRLLNPEGTLFFSTNSRKFVLDTSLFPNCIFLEITKKTLPIDFHNEKIHRCWKIKKAPS